MIEVHCSHCGARFSAPATLAGHTVSCVSCARPVFVPDGDVIEVRAVALNDSTPDPEPEFQDDPFFDPAHQRPAGENIWGRTIHVQRTSDGGGCCLIGCLGMLFIGFLIVRGFLSLF